jgi:hypothetical protein
MKKNPVLLLSLLSCATAAFLGISSASANILVPGTAGLPDIFVSSAGEVLLASLSQPGTFTTTAGTTSFTINTAVYRDPSNIFGAGDLAFVYQIINSANSATSLERLTGTSFTGFATDVGYTVNGSVLSGGLFSNGTIFPAQVDRNGPGSVVGFTFTVPGGPEGGVAPGTTSSVLVIETNATTFAAGNLSVIDGGSFTGSAFQPTGTPIVPDGGSTAILMGLGLFGIVLGLRFVPRPNKA